MSVGKKNSNFCFGAGQRQRPAKVRWCSYPARQASASRGSQLHCWNASLSEPHTRLRYFCSPQHTDSAFYPIISQMEPPPGLCTTTPRKRSSTNWTRCWRRPRPQMQDVALFAEMLSLPNDGRYPTFELTPEQRRQKTLEALVSQMEALARQNPVLMIFEDAHWTDPTSLELFGRIVDRIPSLRVLLIVTFRPEFEPPWIGRPYVTLSPSIGWRGAKSTP